MKIAMSDRSSHIHDGREFKPLVAVLASDSDGRIKQILRFIDRTVFHVRTRYLPCCKFAIFKRAWRRKIYRPCNDIVDSSG